MKSSIFKAVSLGAGLLLALCPSYAQQGVDAAGPVFNSPPKIACADPAVRMPLSLEQNFSEPSSLYERKLNRVTREWGRFMPRYSKVQFAGGMGLISMGVGWDYGKKKQWETDVFIGILPKFAGDRTCLTFTLKQNYIPWKLPLNKKFSLEPLETGIYFNKLTSRNFWGREPEKYNGPYYKFATNLRINAFVGQRITLKLDSYRYAVHKSLSLFYELSTNDLYVMSLFTNRTLRLGDILVLSFGIKFQFL